MTVADLVFVNGAVYTVDAARTPADAVAVAGGRIAAVGTGEAVRSLVGPRTEVVDLDGRMLLPGFQDSHAHPVSGGLDMLQCDLHDLHSREDYLLRVKTYAEEHPDREWILGGGWSMDQFAGGTPTKDLLDAIVPDRIVYLPNRDGHSSWVNSRALEVAGITAATPDPPDGRIERDADGAPTGTLHEGAADLVGGRAPDPTSEDMYRGVLEGQRYLHGLGITAWQDAAVSTTEWGDSYSAYRLAAERGELTGRVIGALWWDRERGEEQIEELERLRDEGRIGRFAPTSVKIMQDGVCETFTAAVLEPYLDADGRPTDRRGISFVDPEALRGYVTALDARGFQVHFHALAERAVRECLDAVEAALRANGPGDGRHHLAHLQVIHPDDVPRFRALRAVANAQPLWAAHEPQMDDLTIPFLGEPRWRWQYPFGALVRSGASLCFGSDWPVSTPDPIQGLHVAVNRVMPPDYPYGEGGGVHRVFLPDERLDLATAIAASTIGSAFVNHLDDVTGSIEVGKLADLAIVDRDLFAHPRDEIASARVDATFVEGVRVFERDGAA
ncbi:MAG TPA: amidohydrolase [Actinomycetota bacterium]|nr:amidohydrolase [Actinomycetota bacterium]